MKSQADYFDQPTHRFPPSQILTPPPYQQLELLNLQQALLLKPPAQLIDYGAGSGRVSIHFLKQGFDVLAVDISKQSLHDLEQLYLDHKAQSWGHLTTATKLPTKTIADGLVGADILHHVDLPATLSLMKKALKPGGNLAFSEPNAWHLPWYLFLLVERVPWSIEKNIIHNNILYLKKHFNRAGFHQLKISGHGFLPTMMSSSSWNLSLGRTLSPLAFRLIISSRN